MIERVFTDLVASLPPAVPFVGPETLERRTGRRFRARVGANESAFGISPMAAAAAHQAIRELSWYGDPEIHDLRRALAKLHGVSAEEVLVSAGIDDLLGLAIRACAADSGTVVMTDGSYPTVGYHVAGYGARLETVPYRPDGSTDLEALARRSRETDARLVYLANPDNPSGTWHTPESIGDLGRNLTPRGSASPPILLLDEAYAEFAPRTSAPRTGTAPIPVILLRTFSKAHGMAGARIGYAIGPASILGGLDRVRLHFGVNRVAQAAALASLSDHEFISNVVEEVDRGRRAYQTLARKLGIAVLPSATNFVTFDLGTRNRAETTLNRLADAGVFIRKPQTPPLDRCVRITVGTEDERHIVGAELESILSALDSSATPNPRSTS